MKTTTALVNPAIQFGFIIFGWLDQVRGLLTGFNRGKDFFKKQQPQLGF